RCRRPCGRHKGWRRKPRGRGCNAAIELAGGHHAVFHPEALVPAMARKAQAGAEEGSDFEKGQGPATRTERDSMGPMEVPIDALWGASTQRAVLNFPVSGLRLPPEFIRSLGLVKWAAAQANKELKVLDGKVADAVSKAALSIYDGEHL